MVNRLELVPDMDTYCDEYYSYSPYGDSQELILQAEGSYRRKNILLHWDLDLTGILSGAVINSAKLIITPYGKDGDMIIDILNLLGPFDANTAYNFMPDFDYSINYSILPVPVSNGVPFEVDITALVQAWVNAPADYYGLTLCPRTSDDGSQMLKTKSREASIVGGGIPLLVIEFNNNIHGQPAPERNLPEATRTHYEDVVKKHAGVK